MTFYTKELPDNRVSICYNEEQERGSVKLYSSKNEPTIYCEFPISVIKEILRLAKAEAKRLGVAKAKE